MLKRFLVALAVAALVPMMANAQELHLEGEALQPIVSNIPSGWVQTTEWTEATVSVYCDGTYDYYKQNAPGNGLQVHGELRGEVTVQVPASDYRITTDSSYAPLSTSNGLLHLTLSGFASEGETTLEVPKMYTTTWIETPVTAKVTCDSGEYTSGRQGTADYIRKEACSNYGKVITGETTVLAVGSAVTGYQDLTIHGYVSDNSITSVVFKNCKTDGVNLSST